MKVLPQSFYLLDPKDVAINLLGKRLVRRIGGAVLSGLIVETEAYYGSRDPASRARRKGRLAQIMLGEPGRTLIYMVHGNWLLNIVTCPLGVAGAVLIRAIEPLEGLELMRKNREGVKDLRNFTNGPGKLSKALNITGELNGVPVYRKDSEVVVCEGEPIKPTMVARSFRIGVSKDLDTPLRFYIKGNIFVSKT